jgi:hypothetical protein
VSTNVLPLMRLLSALLLFACLPLDAQSTARLVPVQRYGWDDIGSATRPLTASERRLSGAVFANVGAVAEGADGALYVLDNQDLKVVVFNPDGTLRRVFGGTKGHGPGEFDRPRDIALTSSGGVYVLDQTLSRIEMFDTTGVYRRTLTLGTPSPLFMAVADDRVFVVSPILGSRPVVIVYDTVGTLRERLVVPSAEMSAFARAGEAYRIGLTRRGTPVVVFPEPGVWAPLANPAQLMGQPLVTDNRIRQRPGRATYTAPASTRGFGELHDGRMLVYYQEWSPESFAAGGEASIAFKLALLGTDGKLVAQIPVPADAGAVFRVSRNGREVLLSFTEPYPHLVRYRIE